MRDLERSTDYKIRNDVKILLASLLGKRYDETITGPDQPFMDLLYVKAKDLANHIRDKFGSPDVAGVGKALLQSKKLAGKGVMYLGGFWHGGEGDHIDLWDGQKLNVTGTAEDSVREIGGSHPVWLWYVRS